MSERFTVPHHRDYARALRAVLAHINEDEDALRYTFAEVEDPASVSRLVNALLVLFATFAKKRLKDPEGYLLSWVQVELLAAEQEEEQDDV